jgi:hypothetical protein
VEADSTLDHFGMPRQPVAAAPQLGPQPHQVIEVAVGQPLPDQRPQALGWLQFRGARRKPEQPDVGRHRQGLGHVPAGVVERDRKNLDEAGQ